MSAAESLRCFLTALLALAFAEQGCVTRGQQARLGDEAAKQVEQQLGLVRDAALEGYVRAIGEKLAAASALPGGPWKFQVVDASDPNAFALPGGHVYVTRGLLALVNSEDELAGVIGHEIGHVTAQHSAKRIGAAVITAPIAIGTGLAGLVLGIASPLLGSVVAGTGQLLTSGLVIAPYSREQEHAADEIGQGLTAAVGYDPDGISRFLHTLDREVTLQAGKQSSFHFLDSHPMAPDRVERTAERARTLARAAGQPVASGRADFLRRLDGIVIGSDPAQGVFEEHLFLHPELDLAIAFPPGWETANTAEAVGAMSPDREAVAVLRVAAAGGSLDAVVAEVQREQQDLAFERFEIGGLPAARSRFASRGRVSEITLIGYRGDVYALIADCAEGVAKAYGASLDATARSFRALRAGERTGIRESRLRAREARVGETPASIAERTGSSWKPEQVAVANAVEVGSAFGAGSLVKLSLPQPYTPRGRSSQSR